jgi:hypothetical protein
MKQWELRGVTVDRWGFPMSPSSLPSSRNGEGASDVTRRAGAESTPPPARPDEDVRHSER